MTYRSIAALALCASLAACAAPAPSTVTVSKAKPAAAASPKVLTPASKAQLSGTVVAPAGLVAAGGGNLIGNDGGSLVGNDGGSLIGMDGSTLVAKNIGQAVPRRHLQAIAEAPLVGAPVWLVPAGDTAPPKGAPLAVTDAKGHFSIAAGQASTSGAYKVVVGVKTAAGKAATLESLVSANPGGLTTAISGASTMVAAALQKGHQGSYAAFNAATFSKTVTALAKRLTETDLPDFSDREAVAAAFASLAAQFSELASALDEVTKQLDSLQKEVDDLGDDVPDDVKDLIKSSKP